MNAFGIDLGSSNIKIYNASDDTYFMEKNMIAIKGRDTLYAYHLFPAFFRLPAGSQRIFLAVSVPVLQRRVPRDLSERGSKRAL